MPPEAAGGKGGCGGKTGKVFPPLGADGSRRHLHSKIGFLKTAFLLSSLCMLIRSLILLILPVFLFAEEQQPVGTHRVFQFENEHVRVWKTVIMPNQPLKMHRHEVGRVIVGLKGGTLKKIEETGEVSDLVFDTGVAYWLDKDPPNTLHGDINLSDEPIEVMVIELKGLE